MFCPEGAGGGGERKKNLFCFVYTRVLRARIGIWLDRFHDCGSSDRLLDHLESQPLILPIDLQLSFLGGSAVEGVKAAAAFNALNAAKADIIVAPQDIVKSNSNLFTKEIMVQVSGYAGRLKGLKQVAPRAKR